MVNARPVVKPLVVLAAKFLGPGPLRLKMVKLAHELDDPQEPRQARLAPAGGWVLPLREAFPLQMDDFDRQLEAELARMLDRVVRAPAPPRRGRPEKRPILRLYSGPGSSIAPVATVVVMADAPVDGIHDRAGASEPPAIPGAALLY